MSVEMLQPDAQRASGPARGRRAPLAARSYMWLLVASDAMALVVATVVAAVSFAPDDAGASVLLFMFPAVGVAAIAAGGGYRPRLRRRIFDESGPLLAATGLAAMAVVAATLVGDIDARPGRTVAPAWVMAGTLALFGRAAVIGGAEAARKRWLRTRPALIIGAGATGAHVARRLELNPEYGLHAVGYIDDAPPPAARVPDRRAPVLGTLADLRDVIAERDVQHVLVAFTALSDRRLLESVRACQAMGVQVFMVPRLFETIGHRVALDHLGGLPVLAMRTIDPHGWQFAVKHAIDRVLAAVLLLILSPLMITIAVLVRLSSRGPAFFRQPRVGRDGCVFDMLKFRSMRPAESTAMFVPAGDSAGGGVQDADRRTLIGRIIRMTSLDELPQLLNVVRGEMSLVGPRPERVAYAELFQDDIARYGDRHRVRAGITGWAQVHGLRGANTSLADRIEWDNYYIENWSLKLDVKILLLTLKSLIARD